MSTLDQKRGYGRTLRRDARDANDDGFRAGFLLGKITFSKCERCDLGEPLVKLRHQSVHRVGFANFICQAAG